MQLISTLALAASASALVAPVAPKASTALKGATLDDQLKKIPGVSPLKNAPALPRSPTPALACRKTSCSARTI